ncbi:MAG TPA: agmatine deiminase family protein [Candidatus Bathyarchaeia archaeon]|nr:agmatine deiminase family protein [Candidatus Bathyarchaeia archaeon]
MPPTPYALGYRMPAEWERHEATWLTWPKNPTTFPPRLMDEVEQIYVTMIEGLAPGERVNLLVDDTITIEKVSSLLENDDNVVFHTIKTADVWVRDYGPIFLKNSNSIAATKWIFNAWGNKYEDLRLDHEIGKKIAQSTGTRIFEPNMVLEGGSIDVNGAGTCITSKQCLLNKNRNPQLNQDQIAQFLKEYLGVTKVIWLDSGVAGDDTDGHVDDIARFVNKNTIICMTEDNPEDENYEPLQKNLQILHETSNQKGDKIQIVPIRMPQKVDSEEGRLPASYANFYIGNAVVLVPTYDDPNDSQALNTLQTLFPDRKVVGINCKPLLYGLGAIHCVTQQQPI